MAVGLRGIDAALADATDVRDLARMLGVFLLDSGVVIDDDLTKVAHAVDHVERVRVAAAVPTLVDWPGNGRELPSALVDEIHSLDGHPELAALGVLRGLCSGRGPIDRAFEDLWDDLPLRRGDVFPIRTAPQNLAIERATPHPLHTVRRTGLLYPTEYEIYRDAVWATVLVLKAKETLDEAVWTDVVEEGERIYAQPRPCAAVFPVGLGDLALPAADPGPPCWFGIWPKEGVWGDDRRAAVATLLERATAAGCGMAVLPEVCLADTAALAGLVRAGARAGTMPDLVVAGSAHVVETGDGATPIHSNMSEVYFRGSLLMRHRKRHPFVTDSPLVVGEGATDKLPEWLDTAGLRLHIALGRSTRLAILICADAIDGVLDQLGMLAANVVLVPSFTPDDAGFGALAKIPQHNQGSVIVVNGALTPWAVRWHVPDAHDDCVEWEADATHPFGALLELRAETRITPL